MPPASPSCWSYRRTQEPGLKPRRDEAPSLVGCFAIMMFARELDCRWPHDSGLDEGVIAAFKRRENEQVQQVRKTFPFWVVYLFGRCLAEVELPSLSSSFFLFNHHLPSSPLLLELNSIQALLLNTLRVSYCSPTNVSITCEPCSVDLVALHDDNLSCLLD